MPKKDEPRELNPISWMSDDPDLEENLYDFRAIPEVVADDEDEAEADDPKASDAPESVDSSGTEQQLDPANPAPVVKDSTTPDLAASTQTSSGPKTTGNSEPPASGKTQSSSSPSVATLKPAMKP